MFHCSVKTFQYTQPNTSTQEKVIIKGWTLKIQLLSSLMRGVITMMTNRSNPIWKGSNHRSFWICLTKTWTGKPHGYSYFIGFWKLPFENVFAPPYLVWMVGVAVEINLPFSISPALCERGLICNLKRHSEGTRTVTICPILIDLKAFHHIPWTFARIQSVLSHHWSVENQRTHQ